MRSMIENTVFRCRSVVCTTAGLIASYYNRPIFPEYCSDLSMDNKTIYNTMVRIAGSFTSFALGFQGVMYTYGWNRVALLSDQLVGSVCTYGASAINQLLGHYVIPIYMKSTSLTSADYIDYLQTVQVNARGTTGHISHYSSKSAIAAITCIEQLAACNTTIIQLPGNLQAASTRLRHCGQC